MVNIRVTFNNSTMKVIISITSLLAIACITVLLLWYFADRVNRHDNHFKRVFIPHAVIDSNIYSLEEPVEGFEGATESYLYFSTREPGHLILTDWKLRKVKELHLLVPPDLKKKISYQFFTYIRYPKLYTFAYNIPAILVHNLETGEMKLLNKPGTIYTRGVPVANDVFIFRQMDGPTKDQLFSRWNSTANNFLQSQQLTPVLHDGGMATDGKLYFDSTSNKLVYMHSYFNCFLELDTQLNLIHKYRTIDTFSRPKVRTSLENTVLTNNTPAIIFNVTGCVNKGKFLINSMLKADNEPNADFKRHEVIDVYELADGAYKGSFYLPRIPEEKITKLFAFQNKLIIFYNHSTLICRASLFQ